jgi:hypothetical protein
VSLTRDKESSGEEMERRKGEECKLISKTILPALAHVYINV